MSLGLTGRHWRTVTLLVYSLMCIVMIRLFCLYMFTVLALFDILDISQLIVN